MGQKMRKRGEMIILQEYHLFPHLCEFLLPGKGGLKEFGEGGGGGDIYYIYR